ncbi:hypothetical protein KFK09_009506 [Dendrobium nobile]|uniref:Uncharacterized protein n=1 Tax=Dendrobium nobile TaxID=94219 RepID=A0A8T3BJH9_DENNO|nr:hypothetical protein KFK09_009506 [Dendrobium nobile]
MIKQKHIVQAHDHLGDIRMMGCKYTLLVSLFDQSFKKHYYKHLPCTRSKMPQFYITYTWGSKHIA